MKLKRIKVTSFRDVAPGTELHFNDGVNILLGKNGSGKTTLLKLITMLGSGSFPGMEQEEFDLEGDLQSEKGTLRVHATKQTLRLGFVPADNAKIEISIVLDGAFATLSAGGSQLWTSRINKAPFVENFLRPSFLRSALVAAALDRPYGFNELHMRAIESIQDAYFSASLWSRYDEALAFQDKLLKEMSLQGVLANAKLQPLLRVGLPDDVTAYFQEKTLPEALPDQISIESADYLPLRRAVEGLGLKEATLHLALSSQRDTGLRKHEVVYNDPRIYVTKRNGTRLRLEHLSFGQQRLFSFFYYLALHEDVVVADELANGMHHSMIADCLEALGQRQAFLATQNPLLLDHLGFADAEEVRRSFVLCEAQVQDSREWLRWTQLSADEASEFFRDYQVGFQHNNDILRARGLW